MADPQAHDDYHGPSYAIYITVFAALCVFTLVSFVVYEMGLSLLTAAAIIMGVAVVKATLVAMYFMHVKYDWPKLYFLVIPLMILTVMLIVVLLPDIVLTWHEQ